MSTTIRMADGDLFINSAGRGETIDGADKASQDIAEILLTPLDALRDFGSELSSLNVPEPVRVFAGRALISKKVDEAVQRLKRLQQNDTESTAEERIDRINRIIVDQIASTDFVFWVSVLLEDRTVLADQLLGVSLRHQESARFSRAIEEQVRGLLDQP
jgi:phage baseplate assembly protein W